MVCKNCGSEMNDKDLFCKNCGKTAGKEKKAFTLSIPEEKLEDIVIIKEEAKAEDILPEASTEDASTKVKTEEAEETGAEEASAEDTEAKTAEEAEEKTAEEASEKEEALEENESSSETEAEAEKTEESESEETELKKEEKEEAEDISSGKKDKATVEKLKASSEKAHERKTELLKEKQKKKVKRADIIMKVIVCLCAVITVALTFVSGFTGIFRDNGEEKTVGISILLPQDSSLFEETAVKYACLFDEGYNCDEISSDDVLALMRPQSEGGLYASLYKPAEAEREIPDPAKRYEVATASLTKGYTKISAKKIGAVLASLSLENLKDVNTRDYYYYDGYYYFKAETELLEKEELKVSVVSAKKTSEGNYYIVCDITDDSSKKNEEGYKKYFLATLNDKDGEKSWSIRKISSEPLYDDFGNSVKDEKTEKKESLSFTMDRHIIEARTKSGKLYARYIIEHPLFDTQGAAESAINSIYAQKAEDFEALAKKATKNYKAFIKNGGDKKDLPLYTVVSASVKLNDKGYFSIVEKTTQYNPLSTKTNQSEAVGEETTVTEVVFPASTYESYTFSIESGEFVKKDEVTGKDYLAVQELLYRTWKGIENTEEEIYDTDGIGAKIYASPWALTKDGLMFTYTNDKGYIEEITVPYNKLPERTIMK